jgi:putative ABC transport system permease protein
VTLDEALRTAWDNLGSHRLRSGLAMLGIVFGVGAVIAMLAIGAGAEREALQMIERLGLHNVLVRGKQLDDKELEEVRRKSLGVSARDGAAIADAVPGVVGVAPRLEVEAWKILADGGRAKGEVWGVSHLQAELSGLRLAEGRFLDPRDERAHAQVCVLGADLRRDLFGQEPALGRSVKVNDLWLEVVGVLAKGGASGESFQGVHVGSPDRELYLPVTTAQRKLAREPLAAPLDELVVRLAPGTDSGQAGRMIAALLDRLHGGAEDWELVVPEALLAQSRRTQRLFDLVMGCIAGISLLVGGIGIMNIMLASVLERTREIGVRRAVGARRRDVVQQFLVESFALSAAGGLVGVLTGVGIARGVALFAGWTTSVTLVSVVLAAGVALAVGLASGVYPALRAARLDPVEALRYE